VNLPRGVIPQVPETGQESVWDYPRPPRVEPCAATIRLVLGELEVATTTTSFRVLETSHPPNYYLPRSCFAEGVLVPAGGRTTVCEFKGVAHYFDVVAPDGTRRPRAGWSYPDPRPGYEPIAGAVAVYPSAFDLVTVDGEQVRAQEGGFYGGWITAVVVGPFKGAPGSSGW